MPASDQGVNLDRYMLVPRTLVFLIRGDCVLLLKGSENKRLWAGLYNGIGGHVEQGEDVLTAARRELLEETGLTSSTLRLCGVTTVDTQSNPGVAIFIYKAEISNEEISASPEGTPEWVNVNNLVQLPLLPDLPVLLSKVMSMEPGDPPFSAHSWYDESGNLVISIH